MGAIVVVITPDGEAIQLTDEVNAFERLGIIPDDITDTNKVGHAL